MTTTDRVAEVVTINGTATAAQKVLIISAKGELLGEVEGRSSFTTSGSLTHIRDILKDKGYQPTDEQRKKYG